MVLGILLELTSISPTGLSPSLATFPNIFGYEYYVSYRSPATPLDESNGLDSTRFARRYSGYLVLDFFSWRY
jgi:hypothetical protein